MSTGVINLQGMRSIMVSLDYLFEDLWFHQRINLLDRWKVAPIEVGRYVPGWYYECICGTFISSDDLSHHYYFHRLREG